MSAKRWVGELIVLQSGCVAMLVLRIAFFVHLANFDSGIFEKYEDFVLRRKGVITKTTKEHLVAVILSLERRAEEHIVKLHNYQETSGRFAITPFVIQYYALNPPCTRCKHKASFLYLTT